jgi:hypothetical protein
MWLQAGSLGSDGSSSPSFLTGDGACSSPPVFVTAPSQPAAAPLPATTGAPDLVAVDHTSATFYTSHGSASYLPAAMEAPRTGDSATSAIVAPVIEETGQKVASSHALKIKSFWYCCLPVTLFMCIDVSQCPLHLCGIDSEIGTRDIFIEKKLSLNSNLSDLVFQIL